MKYLCFGSPWRDQNDTCCLAVVSTTDHANNSNLPEFLSQSELTRNSKAVRVGDFNKYLLMLVHPGSPW